MSTCYRRQFLQLAGVGGAVFVSGLGAMAHAADATAGPGYDDFFFVQLSDTHWGFEGPPNPDAQVTLPKAVAAVNALGEAPDFVDLHRRPDPHHRRPAGAPQAHGASSATSSAGLKVKTVRFMPGEHDASLDNGARLQGILRRRPTTPSTTRACTSSRSTTSPTPRAQLGDEQLAWLAADLRAAADRRAHRRASRTGRCSTCTRSGTGPRATAPRRSTC